MEKRTAVRCLWYDVLVMMMMMVMLSSADKIPGVCTDVTPLSNQPKRPAVPNQFRVLVECQMLERNVTVSVEQWYNYDSNRAHAHQQDMADDGDFFFDYSNNELLRVDRMEDGACEVLTLAGSDENFLFGVTSTSGKEHVLAPSGALHFDGPELYQGSNHVVRGIVVSSWTSCQYSSILDATMNVTWYFSDPNSWDMQLGAGSVPVRAEVVGRRNNAGSGSHPFHHIYDFFEFSRKTDISDFQLTEGDYCPGRFSSKPFPRLADVFSIQAERLSFDSGMVDWVEEHYDNIHKLNVYVYKDSPYRGLLIGARGKTEVNDFKEGFAYMIDNVQGSCQIRLVSEGQFDYDANKGGTVSQQTSKEFFDVSNILLEYGGVKTMRGMSVDTWVGRAPGFASENVTVEWSFATTDIQDYNNLHDTYQLPVAFRAWEPHGDGKANVQYIYNGFAFTQNEPILPQLDISACFHGVDRVNLRFTIDGSYKKSVTHNVYSFQAAVIDAVADHTGISPLRVSDITLYVGPTDVSVSLDVLDKPSFSGDSTNPATQNSLQDALSLLSSSLEDNLLVFNVSVGTQLVTVKPVKNSGQIVYTNGTCVGLGCRPTAPSADSSTYSAGAIAGVGVAMAVAGGGIGIAGGFFFLRNRS